MSFASAVPFLERLIEDIDAGRLKDLGGVKNEVHNMLSMFTSLSNLANTEDEDQLEALLNNELQALHEKRTKCEARLARLQEMAVTGPVAAEGSASYSAAEKISRLPIPRPSPTDPSVTGEGVALPGSSFSSPRIATTDLLSAIIAFPGGPRTVTIHPPGSRDFKQVVRDEKGDTIIVFETVRRQGESGVYGGGGPSAPRYPDGQPTNRHPETPASTTVSRAPTKPTKSRPSRTIHDLISARASPTSSPSLGKGKGKRCVLQDEDEDGHEDGHEDEFAEEVKPLPTALTPTPPPRTVRRVKESKPSLPPVRRSERVPKPVKRGLSCTVKKTKPAAKRRKVG